MKRDYFQEFKKKYENKLVKIYDELCFKINNNDEIYYGNNTIFYIVDIQKTSKAYFTIYFKPLTEDIDGINPNKTLVYWDTYLIAEIPKQTWWFYETYKIVNKKRI